MGSDNAKKRTGPGTGGLVFLHFRLQSVQLRVGSNTPDLSLSDLASLPGGSAEDQDLVCRLHVKVDEQAKQRAKCELNVLDQGHSKNAVVAFDTL